MLYHWLNWRRDKMVKKKTRKIARKPKVNITVDGNWDEMHQCGGSDKDGIFFGLFLIMIAAIFYYGFQWELALAAFGVFVIISSLFKKK